MDDLVILYTTWPDAETAADCARAAVDARLAACANLLAPMRSIYRWEDRIQSDTEIPMLLKTTQGGAERLREFITARHPYETPCIVALQTWEPGCNPGYASWAKGEIG